MNEPQHLNKFERARLLAARALELSKGDKPKVKLPKGSRISKDYVLVAEQELEQGKLDLEIYK